MLLDYIDQAQGVGQCRPLNEDHKNMIKSVMAYNPASTQGEVNLLAAYRPPSTRYPDGVPAENMKRDDITTDIVTNWVSSRPDRVMYPLRSVKLLRYSLLGTPTAVYPQWILLYCRAPS